MIYRRQIWRIQYCSTVYCTNSNSKSSSNFQQSRDRRQQIKQCVYASVDTHRASRVQINEKASTAYIIYSIKHVQRRGGGTLSARKIIIIILHGPCYSLNVLIHDDNLRHVHALKCTLRWLVSQYVRFAAVLRSQEKKTRRHARQMDDKSRPLFPSIDTLFVESCRHVFELQNAATIPFVASCKNSCETSL
jgi:hypothetical protein